MNENTIGINRPDEHVVNLESRNMINHNFITLQCE